MLDFRVDENLCTRCGLCVTDCPNRIIEKGADGIPRIPEEKEERCIRCQHCLAVCPAGALSILGKFPADSLPLDPEHLPDFRSMDLLVRGRRSVRHYRPEPVDPGVIGKILATLAHSPTGVNTCELTFNVIEDPAVMERLKENTLDAIKGVPFPAGMPERYRRLLGLPNEKLAGILFRGAPHALIVTAPLAAPTAGEDAAIAAAYFDLLAQSAGLGCVWWGFLRLFTSLVPGIGMLYGIPENHAFSALLFGRPAVRYARTVQKDGAARIRRITA